LFGTLQVSNPAREKILRVAQKMYGARDLVLTAEAERDLREIELLGYTGLPISVAKTEKSLSDDPHQRGRPTDFEITVAVLWPISCIAPRFPRLSPGPTTSDTRYRTEPARHTLRPTSPCATIMNREAQGLR
jgi:hypothetical protein